MDWGIYERYISSNGKTEQEEILEDAKINFSESAVNNLGYYPDVIYNGQKQKRQFLIQRTESYNKVKIVAFPDEKLFSGDILECGGEKLLVTNVYLLNKLQTAGLAWICNINLKFQNGSSEIIEIPAALDDGTYSTTVGEEKDIQYPNKKFRIYLPYNEDTEKIFIDKRLCIDVSYDKYGKKQLEVYKVSGINHKSVTFGKNSHLLELTVASDQYSPEKDNLEEMICDYIAPTSQKEPPLNKLRCSISGNKFIYIGNSRTYSPIFYNNAGEIVPDITPIWDCSVFDGISFTEINGAITISADEVDNIIGKIIKVTLKDDDENYEPCTIEIEVTA